MDWENIIGYVCMISIAAVSVALVWILIVGICIVADVFGGV